MRLPFHMPARGNKLGGRPTGQSACAQDRRGLRRVVHRFAANDRGAVAVLAGLMLPIVIGGIGLGVETSYWYMVQRKLQHAADVAAYAGAVRHRAGDLHAEVQTAATIISAASGWLEERDGSVSIFIPPATGDKAGLPDHVQAVVVENWPRWFTGLFAEGQVLIRASATAAIETGTGQACILALSGTATQAVSVTGSTSVTLTGCSVASNSVQADAFSQGGSGTITTDCVTTVGGVTESGGLTTTEAGCPLTTSAPVRDPYEDVAEPALPSDCDKIKQVGKPGKVTTVETTYVYPSGVKARCFGNGLDIKGDVTFAPGLYIITGGDFTVNGGGPVSTPPLLSGSGVTFFITGTAQVKLNGNATLNLSAPIEGPYSGILFFGDRDATGLSHVINGNSGSTLTGAIYFPAGDLTFSGSSTGTNGCTQVIASTVTLTGNSALQADCSAAGTSPIYTNEPIALVE